MKVSNHQNEMPLRESVITWQKQTRIKENHEAKHVNRRQTTACGKRLIKQTISSALQKNWNYTENEKRSYRWEMKWSKNHEHEGSSWTE